jgi:hypothetical protein
VMQANVAIAIALFRLKFIIIFPLSFILRYIPYAS